MAKAKSTAQRAKAIVSEDVGLKLSGLIRRVEVVECTAACVESALLEWETDPLTEIAICVEHNIADELGRISRDAAAIYAELRGEFYTPLLKSPILGLRIKPVTDKATRKSC